MTTTPNPTPMPFSNGDNNSSGNNSKKILIGAGIIIALLLGTNIFLFVNKFQQGSVIEKQGEELTSVQKLNDELEKQYNEANQQLEEMKGTNTELNALIDKQKGELSQQKDKIASMINDAKDLRSAKAELGKLRGTVDSYLAQIKDLQGKNDVLTETNSVLTTEKTELQQNLVTERTNKEQAIAAKEAITVEKTKIETEKENLNRIASVVKTSDIVAEGFTLKSSGKEVKKKYAENIQRLKLCFNLAQNDIAAGGPETFYVRLISPTGETLQTADTGGGQFKSTKGEDIPYTYTKVVDYNKDAMNVCTVWDTKNALTLKKGNYDVEIWNKTFLCGKGTFTLK